jgi:DNA recombination protein RmuC
MEFLTVILALVAGVAIGAMACWLALGGRRSSTEADVVAAASARTEAAEARADAANARSEAAAARTEAARADTEIERARSDVALARADVAEARAETANALADIAVLESAVGKAEAQRDAALARAAELTADRESIVNQFRLLSTDALEHQGKIADASAEHRLKATELLMAPVKETLERFESRLTEVEKERAAIAAELKQQVLGVQLTGEQLRLETAKLTTALRKPHVRGSWGEVQLRRVVELAGMVEHCDFDEQTTTSTDERMIRPDLKVSMSSDRFMYVDSKVPLSGFLDAQDAPDDAGRAAALGRFAKNVRGHVEALGAKQYWKADESGSTPEFVIMFVPSEALFAEAVAQMPDLIEFAATKQVVVTTPSSLIGLLRAIAFGWRQAALAQSAREISELGRVLYDRLGTMGSHVDKLGRAIKSSVTAYNDAVGTLESRVLVSARKLRDLQVTQAELPEPSQVEVTVRSLAAPELVEHAAGVEPMIGRGSKRALTIGDDEAALLARPVPGVEELTLFGVQRRATGLTGEAAQG